jgi:exodeoxyribonuclease VII small subunit
LEISFNVGVADLFQASDVPAGIRPGAGSELGGLATWKVAPQCLSSDLAMTKPKQTPAEQNFEGAMDRLEAIVEQMESGKLPLEDLIVRYEEGMNLVKICQERLANAEQKIEIIARNSAGKTSVKDFEPTPEPPSQMEAAEPENKGDEVRLF